MAFASAGSVRIIAWTCALGLATPNSVNTVAGRDPREGVLIKDAEALAQMGVAFDSGMPTFEANLSEAEDADVFE